MGVVLGTHNLNQCNFVHHEEIINSSFSTNSSLKNQFFSLKFKKVFSLKFKFKKSIKGKILVILT